MLISENTIVVTGASRGIGLATSEYFLELGYNVIGFSRQLSGLNQKNFCGIKCDITDDHSVKKAILEIPSSARISGLINCAGITKPNEQLSDILAFKETFEVNLFGCYRVIYHLLPFLEKSETSSIVNIASIGGVTGFPNNPAYGASKAAVINLSKSLAIDLGCKGVRVNSVSPGYFKTDMTSKSYSNPVTRKLREDQTILGRFGEVSELMGILEYLVSDKSSYATGQIFIVDGGWTSKGLNN